MNNEGPTTRTIAAHRVTSCGPCKYHKLTGSFHVRIGEGGWREYSCTHPDAWEPVAGDTPAQAETRGRLRQMEADMSGGGRHIGKTEETPDWCPFVRRPPMSEQAREERPMPTGFAGDLFRDAADAARKL